MITYTFEVVIDGVTTTRDVVERHPGAAWSTVILILVSKRQIADLSSLRLMKVVPTEYTAINKSIFE